MRCPKCGKESVVEIASSSSHRQWLCSDCGNLIRSSLIEVPSENKEKSIREKCIFYSRAWEMVGVIVAAILVIVGLFIAINENSLISFIVYAVIGVLIFLSASTVSIILTYLALKK